MTFSTEARTGGNRQASKKASSRWTWVCKPIALQPVGDVVANARRFRRTDGMRTLRDGAHILHRPFGRKNRRRRCRRNWRRRPQASADQHQRDADAYKQRHARSGTNLRARITIIHFEGSRLRTHELLRGCFRRRLPRCSYRRPETCARHQAV